MSDYPKSLTLKDGRTVTVVAEQRQDLEEARRFFSRLPEEDRLFLGRDLTCEEGLDARERALRDGRVFRLAVHADGELVGEATLHHPLYGWTRHVAEMQVVVAPEYRQHGLGRLLTQELFHTAIRLHYSILDAYVLEENTALIHLVEHLGFRHQGVLRNHAIDLEGRRHHLAILSFDAESMWQQLQEAFRTEEARRS